jgi:hypothetical protein
MPNFQIDLNRFLWSKLVWVFELIVLLTPDQWTMLCGFAALFGIVGLRLGRFTKPESPRFSHLIRHASRLFLFWPSVAALGLVALVWAVFFVLCFILNVVPKGLETLHAEILAIGWGMSAGLLSGALAFYWWIPGLEVPAITAAAPDVKLPTIDSYDPEKYFRV